MKFFVRTADADEDYEAVCKIFNETRAEPADTQRFKWLYRQNPAGEALLWVIVDEVKDSIVGAAASLPRWMWIKGKLQLAFVLADFSIQEEYRSLGPALKLNRATLEPVRQGLAVFAYDFPSRSMAAVHRWMKIPPLGRLLRLVRPMALSQVPADGFSLNIKKAFKLLDGPFRKLQRIYPSRKMARNFHYVESPAVSEVFDNSFTALDRRVAGQYSICGARDAAYLRWHYALNPIRTYHVIQLYQKDRLCGYAIVHWDEGRLDAGRLKIYDLFCESPREIRRNLLAALLAFADRLGANFVEVSLLESNTWCEYLKQFGFLERPDVSEVFVFPGVDPILGRLCMQKEAWYLTLGDRDT